MLLETNNGIEKGAFMLTIIDIDKTAEFDLRIGKGMLITEPIKDKKTTDNTYNKKGIRSDWFYSEMQSDTAFQERYSCECGKTMGKSHESMICPYCGKPVKLVDIDLEKFGYIKIKDYNIIHPALYVFLDNMFGTKNKQSILANIIKNPHFVDTDKNGDPIKENDEEEFDKDQPFKKIGMIEFQKRFDEIFEFYVNKNKRNSNMEANADFVRLNRDKLFCSYIPVYSSALRFSMIQDDMNYVNKADKIYNIIYSAVNKMNNSNDTLTVDTKLPYIQKKVQELFDLIFKALNKKDGIIKSTTMAGRNNMTSRNVIKSNPSLAADEIILSYLSFLEIYKFEIIHHLSVTQNITQSQAYDEWYKGCIKYSEKIYKIIKMMIKKDQTYVVINRPPTIDLGSMLQMKIVDVTRDINDLTMSIPLMVLVGLNADFDGDTLTKLKLSARDQIKDTLKYNPRLYFMISHDHGLLNEGMLPIKDLAVGLSNFNRI